MNAFSHQHVQHWTALALYVNELVRYECVFGTVWEIHSSFCHFPLPSARPHPSYDDCLDVRREYYQNSSMLDCVTQNVHSQQHTYMSSSYRSNRLGLSQWDTYAMHRGGCLELYYCNMVEWFWWDSSLIFDDQLVFFSALTLLVWSSDL